MTEQRGGRVGRTLAGLALVIAIAALVVVVRRDGTGPQAARDWTAEWQTVPPVVATTPGGLLETGTLTMAEDFYRSDRRTWWGIYLGETASHIQASATYRYGVPLSDPDWQLVCRGAICVVVAPTLRPSLPVAIDTATLREKTENGWARFDKAESLDALRRSLSDDLEQRAQDPARLALVRDASRRTIGEFVEQWLVARAEWEPGAFRAINVHFADEVDGALRAELRAVR